MKYFSNDFYVYTTLVPTDLYPVQYGEEQCKKGHSFGPCIRSNYLIHYVYSGKGILKTGNKEYHIGKGEMFLISPDELAYYKADDNEPWHYAWIEFNGSLASHMLDLSGFASASVCPDNEQSSAGKAMKGFVKCSETDFVALIQCLWKFLGEVSDKNELAPSLTHEYVNKAENYIKTNVHKKITVSDVAAYVGIDRSYLSRLFQQYKKISPQSYILSFKMNTAANYLKNTGISVSEAAQSVGYWDIRTFSKAFKKQFNASPSAWMQKIEWNKSIIS